MVGLSSSLKLRLLGLREQAVITSQEAAAIIMYFDSITTLPHAYFLAQIPSFVISDKRDWNLSFFSPNAALIGFV